ncbi:MAG: helix-turn-helix domain-containing protein [Christensenellales bacterium]|uniref:Helix-turn-helix domain-containing protein n=1 Tax=Candidatus Avichristensenella intestinipullorum TaxID=2840693 RepID=A0A9D0YUJ7_9FIRM|nr:helix-turn-helix domain-containing protein [Christensenellales bacterium]HIQ61959.1 helix-turn-helix domain-containing protein [Candidatus Avichristensenella intestinipullorum]
MMTLRMLAECTGLTEKTLRNYMRMGLLRGEKSRGKWQFPPEALEALLTHPYTRPSIRRQGRILVEDFLQGARGGERACVVLDLCLAAPEDGARLRRALVESVNRSVPPVRMVYEQDAAQARVFLSGDAQTVQACLAACRARCDG